MKSRIASFWNALLTIAALLGYALAGLLLAVAVHFICGLYDVQFEVIR